MKRNLFNAAFVVVWIVLLALVMGGVILIVTDAAKADEIEVVDIIPTEPVPSLIEILASHQPAPTRYEKDADIPVYTAEKEDVEILAKLLWSSPLRSEAQKRKLCWLVLNRVDDKSGTFPNTVKECVNKKEFTFYDRKAHISDKNKAIATDVLKLWQAEKDGYKVGRRPSKNALYLRFDGDNNQIIDLTTVPGGESLEW